MKPWCSNGKITYQPNMAMCPVCTGLQTVILATVQLFVLSRQFNGKAMIHQSLHAFSPRTSCNSGAKSNFWLPAWSRQSSCSATFSVSAVIFSRFLGLNACLYKFVMRACMHVRICMCICVCMVCVWCVCVNFQFRLSFFHGFWD